MGGRETFSIRKASTRDAHGIVDCLQLAFDPYRPLYTPAAFRDTVPSPEGMVRRLAEMVVFVAVSPEEEVLGTASYSLVGHGEGHVRGMAVRPEWQGGGVAHELMEAIEAELRGLGRMRLTLGTTEHLQRAMRFYEKRGFRRSGNVSDFHGMVLVEYVKTLPG